MFISIEQLHASLTRLAALHPFYGTAFLAFKKHGLPIGRTAPIVQSRVVDEFMQEHFRPLPDYPGYYNPFATSKGQEHWVSARYASTATQRILTDTFRDAFIHKKGQSEWGWKPRYLRVLRSHLGTSRKIPAFDLAVWLYRDARWPRTVRRQTIRDRLFHDFNITRLERDALFNSGLHLKPQQWLREQPISSTELIDLLGPAPGERPPEGALLRHLAIVHVGPGERFEYWPADRLNIITGDNSLGKTFLLDVIWWTLSDNWCSYQALPNKRVAKKKPQIAFEVSAGRRATEQISAQFDWDHQVWSLDRKRRAVAGLVVYARYDGSFAVWDPARAMLSEKTLPYIGEQGLLIKKADVWHGLRVQRHSGEHVLCDGLLNDWIKWQVGSGRYQSKYDALVASLEALSPSADEPLAPGDPMRLPLESQEYPTLRLPYGDVPLILASAGVQRAVALAYILVWTYLFSVPP